MSFKELLIEKLKGKVNEKDLEKDKNSLPSGFQKIGEIIILNLKPEILCYKKEIGESIIELFPKTKTICNKTGEIKGEFREPQIEIITGDKNTEVEHFENSVYFCFDVRKIMFAKGNLLERGRIPKQVKTNEIIVDMFTGIGYFSVPIAKIANPKKIYAIELNPVAIKYLKKTIEKNKLKNIEVIEGDSRVETEKLAKNGIKADRIIMGYLPPPKEFLEFAMKIAKKGTIIHYDDLIRTEHVKEDLDKTLNLFNIEANKLGMHAKLINPQRVKSYGPKIDHYVLDIKLE
jgi:tRNA wybutosine-synthesizing protein 2